MKPSLIILSLLLLSGCSKSSTDKYIYGNGRFSVCQNCHTPWNRCRGHNVNYDKDRVMFAICEDCWNVLNPNQRLECYRIVWDHWSEEFPNDFSDEQWKTLKTNILKEELPVHSKPLTIFVTNGVKSPFIADGSYSNLYLSIAPHQPLTLVVDAIGYPKGDFSSNRYEFNWTNLVCHSQFKPVVTQSNGLYWIRFEIQETHSGKDDKSPFESVNHYPDEQKD